MPGFTIPMTLRVGSVRHELLVTAGGDRPVSWSELQPLMCAAAGLPPATPLFAGAAEPPPRSLLGQPPLLAGLVLSDHQVLGSAVAGPLVLDCVAGPDAGSWIALPDTDSGDAGVTTVGRAASCDLVLDDPDISGRHLRLATTPGGLQVLDLLSTNGSRCAGRTLVPQQPAPVRVGELIELGGSTLRVDLDDHTPMLRTADGTGHWSLDLPAVEEQRFAAALPPDPGPPPVPSRRPVPVVAALAAALAGVLIAVVMRMWMLLLLAALGPISMLAGAWGERFSGRRTHRADLAEHRARREAFDAAVADAAAADAADAWDRFADPARLLRWARTADRRLWARRAPPDSAGWQLAVAIGDRPARLELSAPPTVSTVPLLWQLPAAGVVALAGRRRATCRWLIAQLVGLWSPGEVQLRVLSERDDLAPLADLPHAVDGDAPGDIAHTGAELAAALSRAPGGTRQVAVIDGYEGWRADPDLAAVLSRPDPGLLVLVVCENPGAAPQVCSRVLDTDAVGGDPIGVSADYLRRLCSALTPLTVPASGRLPARLLAPVPSRSDIAGAWTDGCRPVATLGRDGSGPVTVDLIADGPHLLIAGTTGAGKSELLQSLIAGLAGTLAPPRLAFLLVDYKGGSAFARASELPHTTGMLTDLDPQLAARALTSLRAEIRCRERFLARAGAADLGQLRPADCPDLPPRLVIVVDEFATLAADLPDFLSGLVDIAQRGRSLGLHLVLATQRPAGVVSQAIRANIGARICLRVADEAESVDVLGSPAAAAIPAELPGRAILRAPGKPLRTFQVHQVTRPIPPAVQVRRRGDARLAPQPVAIAAGSTTGRSTMDQLIDNGRALAAGMQRPAPPWLPALPERLHRSRPGELGVIDLPADQQQHPWTVPAASLLITGDAGSGRSSAARRWAHAVLTLDSAAPNGHDPAADSDSRARPSDAELVVVDAMGALSDMRGWPVTTTWLDGSDPALVGRTVDLLSDLTGARAAGSQRRPHIAVLIDGWQTLAPMMDVLDYGQWQHKLADLAARGPRVGILVCVTGDHRLADQRIAAGFGSRLALGAQVSAQSPLGHPIAGTAPGRGRLCGPAEPVHGEVQVALPLPDPPAEPVRARGGASVIVRSLPTVSPASDLPPPRPSLIAVGVGGDDARPIGFDLTGPGGGLLVAGQRRSGVSTTLRVLAGGAAAAGIRTGRLISRSTAPIPGVRDLDLRAGTAGLLSFLRASSGPLLLIADELAEHSPPAWPADPSSGSIAAGDLLIRCLAAAAPGQFVAIGARLGAVTPGRGLTGEVAAFRTGVLLGADAADGRVLEVTLPKRRDNPPPGRGHLVVSGSVRPLQVATDG